jgi:hypothetical protein
MFRTTTKTCWHGLIISITTIILLVGTVLPGIARAASNNGATPTKGLIITPVRQFLSADAGSSVHSTFTVINKTNDDLHATFSVQQFSVNDYAYNYVFSPPANNWLHVDLADATLQPGQSLNVPFTVTVPAGTAPGGHYYTLFAGASVSVGGVSSTIQATDLLYMTVNGQLDRTSHLQSSSIQWLSFGRTIPFSLQPINTGNVYFYAYVSGQLHGLLVKPASTPTSHLLMPNKPRDIEGSIASPILPGIYRAAYGYKTDAGQIVTQSHWIVFIPPWFIAFVLATLLFAGKRAFRKEKSENDKSAS